MQPAEKPSPLRAIWAFIFAYAGVSVAINSLSADPILTFYIFPFVGLLALFAGLGRVSPSGQPNKGWWLPLIPLAMWMTWYIFISLFGAFSVPAILFHFRYQLNSNGVAGEIAERATLALLPFLLLAICWVRFARRHSLLQRLGTIAFIPFMLLNPMTVALGKYAAHSYLVTPFPLKERYVDPAKAMAPAGRPRNLVRILLESTERTLWDETVFSDIAAPLKRLERRGFSATGIEQSEMTGWTLAGMVASGCGVPLFGLGAINGNSYDVLADFMPEAHCLGDLLRRDGYDLAFFKGAELTFSGTDVYLGSHSFQEAYGFHELTKPGQLPDNAWGLDDEKIFDAAFRRIQNAAREGRPFNVSLVTLGGHFPSGYLSTSCQTRPEIMKYPNNTMRAFACTNHLTEEFVDRLEAAGLLENTIVAIQSDHLAMQNEIFAELLSRERRNTFIVLGDGLEGRVNTSPATMVDVYPTLLEALGYELPRHRAGLGVSLLSGQKTLREDLGLAALDEAIVSNVTLRDFLWQLKPVDGASSRID